MTVDRIVPMGETFHYVWIKGDEQETFVEKLKTDERLPGLKIVDSLPDRILIRFEWSIDDSPIFQFIGESNARIESLRGSEEGWSLDVRFPDQASIQAFYGGSQDAAIDIELRQIYESNDLSEGNDYGVSERQFSTLLLALQEGFFEIPRKITIAELSERLGVSKQAVSERIRRGLSSVIQANDIGSRTDDDSE